MNPGTTKDSIISLKGKSAATRNSRTIPGGYITRRNFMSEACERWVSVCETIKKWFGKDAKYIIQEMEYCNLNESWTFEYAAPFDQTGRMVRYHVSKWDGNITFFED
jgi:hypothetical protein